MNHKITVARSGKPDARNALLFTATCTCGHSSGPCGLGGTVEQPAQTRHRTGGKP